MKSFISWFCLLAGSNLAIADEGLDAYRLGDYAKASTQLNKSHEPVTNYYLGRMYLYGYGLLKNNNLAMRSFQEAANKGFLAAQRILALYALTKENNPEQALYWFKRAASANDSSAQMYCAAAYLFGVGVQKNSDIAKRYYIAAARNGDSTAQTMLAEDFLKTRQLSNKKLGLIWLNKAFAQNQPEAQLKLGEMYADGELFEKNLPKAQELIGLAAAQNYAPAIYQMGKIFEQQQDVSQAKDWYTRALALHYQLAAVAISNLYTEVKSPLYNVHLGFLWMLKSAQNGVSEAQLGLADMYKNGIGVEVDTDLAEQWRKKSIESSKNTPTLALAHAAQLLSNGKTCDIAASGYSLQGIFNDWKNPQALQENHYNQAPQLNLISSTNFYKPKFSLSLPNEVAINEYYHLLVDVLYSAGIKDDMTYPRYQLEPSSPEATLNYLQGRAALGDSSAQFTLAQMYQNGVGTDKNINEAIRLYELASAQQELRAEYNLGMIYLEGQGIAADYKKAMSNLRDAAFKGNDYAQYTIARIYELGYRNGAGEIVIAADHEQAMLMYDLASSNDYGLAQYRLAEMMVRENKNNITLATATSNNMLIKELYQKASASGIKQAELPLAFFNAMDKSKALQTKAFTVATKEAQAGNSNGAILLGLLYDRGIGVSVDATKALFWYQKSQLNPVSAFILGTYYSDGRGLVKDRLKGVELLTQAAAANFSYAYLNLAIIQNESKQDFLPDLKRALELGNNSAGLLLADYYMTLANNKEEMQQARNVYQHLAEKGDRGAQLKLAFMLNQGLGGQVDIIGAQKLYSLAAAQGQILAIYMLGQLNQLGTLGAMPDYLAAKQYYSSIQGNYAPAAVALGFIYDTVDDNYKQALASYKLAAAQQDPVGQFNLGLMYEQGKGRAVDFFQAFDCYKQAAELGHVQSMVQLAGLYAHGNGVSQDKALALSWYKKAAKSHDRDALYQLGALSEASADFGAATHYYQLAVDLGNDEAKVALARINKSSIKVIAK